MIKILLWTFLLVNTTTMAATTMTRDALLQECKIPKQRKMPLSNTVEPCENFHQYVCGEVEKKFKLPDDRSSWKFAFTDAHEKILCAKKKYFSMLEDGAEPMTNRMKPAKKLYLSCINKEFSTLSEKDFIKSEKSILDKIKTKDSMLNFLQSRIEDPVGGLVGYGSVPNQANSRKNDILLVTVDKLLPTQSYLKNHSLMKDAQKMIEKFFEAYGMNQASQRAGWVISYEKGLQRVLPTPVQQRALFTKDTYRDAKHFSRYKQLHLQRFISTIPTQVKIRDFISPALLYLDHWLSEANLDQIKTIYAFYKYRNYMEDAYSEYFNVSYEFKKKYFGASAVRPPRQERCTNLISSFYAMEFDAELIEILFPSFPSQKVESLASKVKTSILKGLKSNRWLSTSSKKEAMKKIEKAELFLVKPKTEKAWDFIEPLSLNEKDQIQNLLNIRRAYAKKSWDKLTKVRDKSIWDMSPLTLNAYYHPMDNKFVLLQGILQYPFFSPNYSDVENLGALGAGIGHELGHGIDDKGSAFDSDGQLRNWFTPKDLKEFQKRGQKFVKRFDKIGHNGKLTLGENIGDHVGIFFAYNAAFGGGDSPDPLLIKKFFESYARLWCGVQKPKYIERLLKTDSHSLGWARINEQVIHHGGFQKAYQCKKGDAMFLAPDERIRIW